MPLPALGIERWEEDDGLSVVKFTGMFYSALCAIQDP
jgi:hypothetical protein